MAIEKISNISIERFILDLSVLKARPRALTFQVENVVQWLENAKNPIRKEEVAYLKAQEDLIALVSKERTPLRRLLDRVNIQRRVPCVRDRKVRHQRASQDKKPKH